jgi:hypothetical protein
MTIVGEMDGRAAPANRRTMSGAELVALIAAVVFGLAMIWVFRFRGWFPHDEGTLGQTAERILSGQIPHRDFDDPYTGGLGLIQALAFRVGGINLNVLRDQLALVASIWFAGIVWMLMRWLRPVGAALVAALIVVFSVPLYPAGMPSWYVMFLTCAAGTVLVVGTRRRYSAAFAAGLLVGVAALAKVTAVFALVGAGWALVAIRQAEDDDRRGAPEILLAAILSSAAVLHLVSAWPTPRIATHIALPALALITAVATREAVRMRTCGVGVDVELQRRIAALAAGVALPVILFGIWLYQHGALGPFFASLGAVVGQRAASASWVPPSVQSLLYGVPILIVLFGAGRTFRIGTAVVIGAGLFVEVYTWLHPYAHSRVWDALRAQLPLGALFFCIAWPRIARQPLNVAGRALVVFGSLAALMALSQFPFAAPVYFVYVLPLMMLAIAAAVSMRPLAAQRPAAALAALYLLFGLTQVLPGSPEELGYARTTREPRDWLATRRGRLLVPASDADVYHRLIATIDSLPPGPIWAGPDAPEVAFLSARADLNRSFFSFLARDDPPGANFAAQISARGARAVVVDTAPGFSARFPAASLDSVEAYFPRVTRIDRFEVHTRGDR